MKTIAFLLFFMVRVTSMTAQADDEVAIQARIDTFILRTNAADWKGAFEMIYPKLFTYVPRQELVDMMEEMAADGLAIRMDNVRIRKLSLPVRVGDEAFVRADYAGDMTVHIDRHGKFGSPGVIEVLESQFAASYGKDRVTWEPEASVFRIRAEKAMIAVRGPAAPDWMLVEINPDQPEVMEFLFPPAVLERLVRPE